MKPRVLGYEKGRLTRYVARVIQGGRIEVWRQCRYASPNGNPKDVWFGGHGDVVLSKAQLRKLCAIVAATPEKR